MVIEWKSNTPVWSDTLRPEPSNLSLVIDEAQQSNSASLSSKRKSTTPQRSSTHSVENQTIVAEDPSSSGQAKSPPQSGSKEPGKKSAFPTSPIPLPRRRIFPTPRSPQMTAPDNYSNDHHGIQPGLVQDNANTIHADSDHPTSPSTSAITTAAFKTTLTASNAGVWSTEELSRVEPMAVDYLQRFVRFRSYFWFLL